MKPRTKKEILVVKLSKKLGSVGKRDEQKLIKNTYGSCAYEDMYNRCYAVINQSYQGWQVLRYFRITRHRNRQREVSYDTWEVMQFWSKVGEGQVFLARQRTMRIYVDNFAYNSELEIRKHSVGYGGLYVADIPYAYIYEKSAEGAFKYAGKYGFDDIRRYEVYEFLARNKFAETLLALRPDIARMMMHRGYYADFYFQAFRIAIRHNYEIEQPLSYMDYLNALHYLGKDMHNPYYVCPEDFHAMHDKYIHQMQEVKEKVKAEQIAKEQKAANEKYLDWRKRFFDMLISDGKVECRVLRSVKDFYDEGESMHNCVYKCGYYKKPNSLIFSARVDGKRVETVEFDLNRNIVVQAYGKCNKFSEYHNEIVSLVNANASLIQSYNKNKKQLKVAV